MTSLNTNRLRQLLLPPETFAAGVGASSSRRTIPAALPSIVVHGNQQATGKHQAHRDNALCCRSPLFPTVRGSTGGVCKWGGALRHGSFHALLKVCQDAKRGIAKSFKALFVCSLHAQQSSMEPRACRTQSKGIRNP